MSSLAEIRPTYDLTDAELMFVDLVDNSKYQDHKGLKKQVIKMKSKFILDNVEDFEDQLMDIIRQGYDHGTGSSSEDEIPSIFNTKKFNEEKQSSYKQSKTMLRSQRKKMAVTREKLRQKLKKASRNKRKHKNYNIQFIEGPTGQFKSGKESEGSNLF